MTILPMMPRATATWLVENTILTFDQIAQFCGLHDLEVQSIADGDSKSIHPLDPIINHQLTQEEIARCEKDPKTRLVLTESATAMRKLKQRVSYVPKAQRQSKPSGIAWIVKNHPEFSDGQVSKLLHTTKKTIDAIRTGTHKTSGAIRPQNPITLGLCSEKDFYDILLKVQKKLEREALKSSS
ncbi:MAG: cell cycle transcriptional regulator TrcR [Alphaproteobacteria bacterium]